MQRGIFPYLFLITSLSLFLSCEKNINIKLNDGTGNLVVEGHIETGLPPYVILTRSQPYFATIGVNELSGLFVHNATVKVSNGQDTIQLKEYSSDSLPPQLLEILSGQLGVDLANNQDSLGLKVFAYLTVDPRISGKVGGTYTLDIEAEGTHLSSVTSIPVGAGLDSLWSVPHPTNDTLASLFVRYSDPPGINNYIRYFTSTNRGPFYPPYFQSVLDDHSLFNVDGKSFDFSIEQGHNRSYAVDFNTFTYFTKGDSVIVRWCAIDQAHFEFWNTAEFDRGSTGNPFSSPTKIKSNISGGLGIWGGYNPYYYFIAIPKN